MSSRSLLLGLLVLVCLQSFTAAQSARGPQKCCIRFQKHRIPLRLITAYTVTDPWCSNPGVVFTLKDGRQVCADPEVQWVQYHMEAIDQPLIS